MRMWAQSSQRSTWPPSAAVRQRSIADMTFSWARLTWPALAGRQRGPMATKDVRDLQLWAAHRRPATPRVAASLDQWCNPVEWAGYSPDRAVGDAGVKRRGVEFVVAQQGLDDANIDILFEQMGGEAVALIPSSE